MVTPLQHKNVCTIAPSSQFSAEAYTNGVKVLKDLGCTVTYETQIRNINCLRLNGSDDERLQELHDALLCSDCDIVWFARGGYGLTRIVPQLQLPRHAQYPVVIGFSDATVLLCHLWAQLGIRTIYGPNVTELAETSPEVIKALVQLITGQAQKLVYPSFTPVSAKPPSTLTGRLFAVNLCMLSHLIGTVSMPDLTDGILLLEDIAEQPYQIDRRLTHLYHSGAFQHVKGVIIGHLTKCGDKPEAAKAIFAERFAQFQIPLWANFPCGHEAPNWPVPFGCMASIHTQQSHATLHLLEEVKP